jgi:hypothetical protein
LPINAKEAPGTGGKRQEPIEPGTVPGRLVQIIDLGLQPQKYKEEDKPPAREISTTYELADEFMKDDEGNDLTDKPRWISESFVLHNLAADRAKSTARYYALDPKAEKNGDWEALLGTPVMITIVQKPDKKKQIHNNIASTSTIRARDLKNIPDLVNTPRFLDLEVVTEENLQMFSDLPQWIRDKIKKGLEWQGSEFQIALESFKPKTKDKKDDRKEPAGDTEDGIPTEEGDGNW